VEIKKDSNNLKNSITFAALFKKGNS